MSKDKFLCGLGRTIRIRSNAMAASEVESIVEDVLDKVELKLQLDNEVIAEDITTKYEIEVSIKWGDIFAK